MANLIKPFSISVLSIIIAGCQTGTHANRTDSTIAHELLRVEYEANGGSATEYAERVRRLNLLIDEAVAQINLLKADERSPAGIKSIFAQVDEVLVNNHYNVFIHTKTLWDALSPGIPISGGQRVMTEKMKEHRAGFPDAVYYRFDCDTGTMIHLGVFDRLQKPVVMVETPKHNFLRWRISPEEHVNWDVNDSHSYTDDEHRRGAPRTTSGFDKETETQGHYLRDMTREELRAYHFAITAGILKEKDRVEEAVDMYKRAIQMRPYAAMPRNNLAWMIATQPELQRQDLHDLALSMARSAVQFRPTDGNLIDTLAAVYAARHEFEKAIEIEQGGRKRADRIQAYRAKKTPVEMKWRDEPDE